MRISNKYYISAGESDTPQSKLCRDLVGARVPNGEALSAGYFDLLDSLT